HQSFHFEYIEKQHPIARTGFRATKVHPSRGLMNADRSRCWKLKCALTVCAGLAACHREGGDPSVEAVFPHWSYDSTMVFPADRSLSRAEDGVALPGGRLLVTDQQYGLRLVEPDGTS